MLQVYQIGTISLFATGRRCYCCGAWVVLKSTRITQIPVSPLSTTPAVTLCEECVHLKTDALECRNLTKY
jgi:hypothetical protein